MSSPTWRHVLLGLALWPWVSVSALSAQSVSQGDRVRVHSTETYASAGTTRTSVFTTTGALSGWANDTLRIDTDSQSRVSIAASDIRKLEVSRGRTHQAGKGMAIGAGLGFVFGFFFGSAVTSGWGGSVEETAKAGLQTGAVGAGLGLAIGATLGALASTDAWQEVTVGDLRVTAAPNGLTLSVPVQGR